MESVGFSYCAFHQKVPRRRTTCSWTQATPVARSMSQGEPCALYTQAKPPPAFSVNKSIIYLLLVDVNFELRSIRCMQLRSIWTLLTWRWKDWEHLMTLSLFFQNSIICENSSCFAFPIAFHWKRNRRAERTRVFLWVSSKMHLKDNIAQTRDQTRHAQQTSWSGVELHQLAR
jgi:hypothetical protein